MQYVNAQRNTDLSDLVSVYESNILGKIAIYEAMIDIPTGPDDEGDYFNNVIEVNVAIATDTEIGDVKYKCDVDREKSTSSVLTAVVRGDSNMSVIVTKLPTDTNSLNVTIYVGGETVERFVTTIAIYDEDEMELNITKEELV